MKGIILAAGAGTRLSPATLPVSKVLLPIYDRPMIYYPLATLMEAGIREILIIVSKADLGNYKRVLGDGSQFGLRIKYKIQRVQCGVPDAFRVGRKFIRGERSVLILGDNIFCGEDVGKQMIEASKVKNGAVIFGCHVKDPERFGVIGFDGDKVTSLEEKPKQPKSDCASVGLYFYDENVSDYADTLKPSARGELEITDISRIYLQKGELEVKIFGKDTKWFDAGTFDSLLEASEYIATEEKRLGKKILCPEIIAVQKNFVSKSDMEKWLDSKKENEYYKKVRESI